jgi:hypothetical protein
MNADY